MSIFNRILCPIDFDGNSLDALRLARRIAERDKATLYVLHVVPPQDPLVMSAPAITQRDEEHARTELQKVSNAELKGVDHEVLPRFGHPAEEIVAAESETKAELLVMATTAVLECPISLWGVSPKGSCASRPARCSPFV